MAGQMKVGLIGESVTMHYLDYYCETHKDWIAGFSDVRDDKKYQEDDIDFVVYRKDGSSFTVEAKADTYKTGNVFLETAVNSFAIGEDDKLLRFGKYQKAIAKHSKGWLYKEADYIFYYFIETRQIYVFERMAAMWHFCVDKICELQIIGNRVIYLFFGRVTSPEYASVAQLTEQLFCKQRVTGSNPVRS